MDKLFSCSRSIFAGLLPEIDAAYVRTHGGYRIARSHDDYPVFIEVHDRDVERWIASFGQFGIDATTDERPDAGEVDGSVHYVSFPEVDGIAAEWVDGNPVTVGRRRRPDDAEPSGIRARPGDHRRRVRC